MESPDTFTLLNLSIDPSTKALSSPSASLASHLETLNTTHRGFVSLGTPGGVPGPPLPVQPQRSQQITKLRESAQAALKKKASTAGGAGSGSEIPSNVAEALKLYTLAVDMATSRPPWEPSGLIREEIAATLAGRAEAYAVGRQWADSLVDAKLSIEAKRSGNAAAYMRGGRAMIEMGRRAEAKQFLSNGHQGEEAALQQAKAQLGQLKAQIGQAQSQGQQVPPQAIAQSKQMDAAVDKQEEAMKEFASLLKEVGVQV